jgi:hypothetical protein
MISERIRGGSAGAASPDTGLAAAWRLEQAERERVWALVSARAEGISIRALARAAALSPLRVHQLAALGELRAAGWLASPGTSGPRGAYRAGPDRGPVSMTWLSLRPGDNWPETANVAVDLTPGWPPP